MIGVRGVNEKEGMAFRRGIHHEEPCFRFPEVPRHGVKNRGFFGPRPPEILFEKRFFVFLHRAPGRSERQSPVPPGLFSGVHGCDLESRNRVPDTGRLKRRGVGGHEVDVTPESGEPQRDRGGKRCLPDRAFADQQDKAGTRVMEFTHECRERLRARVPGGGFRFRGPRAPAEDPLKRVSARGPPGLQWKHSAGKSGKRLGKRPKDLPLTPEHRGVKRSFFP